MYRKFIKIIDHTFIIFIIFLLCFIWSKFLIENIFVALIASLLLTFFFALLFLKLQTNSSNKMLLNKKQQQEIQSNITFLTYTTTLNIQKEIALRLNANIVKNNLLQKDATHFYILDTPNLTEENLIEIIKSNAHIQNLSIICAKADQSAYIAAKNIENFSIDIIDAKTLYLKYNISLSSAKPDIVIKQGTKLSLKQFFSLFTREELAKKYCICAIIILFSSIFVFFKIYYYIFASILLILSLYCKIKPKLKEKTK